MCQFLAENLAELLPQVFQGVLELLAGHVDLHLGGQAAQLVQAANLDRLALRHFQALQERLQTLTGFWAEPVAYIDYEDINYDGYIASLK